MTSAGYIKVAFKRERAGKFNLILQIFCRLNLEVKHIKIWYPNCAPFYKFSSVEASHLGILNYINPYRRNTVVCNLNPQRGLAINVAFGQILLVYQ